ncbi:unnamed protein product [Paramecium sonneborni]|uniref:Uncharacterized protein n=1 Tax=Paramecium sonneborni TaxID=65129 RepID=A0A8S1MJK8_9CILI|nr:unnamed protein product [Paramecium sonneborni]
MEYNQQQLQPVLGIKKRLNFQNIQKLRNLCNQNLNKVLQIIIIIDKHFELLISKLINYIRVDNKILIYQFKSQLHYQNYGLILDYLKVKFCTSPTIYSREIVFALNKKMKQKVDKLKLINKHFNYQKSLY